MQKSYLHSIDYIRALAILAVVGIHTSTKTIEAAGFDIRSFELSMFINQILRFAVPLFFVISGFTLELNYPRHGSALAFYKRRLSKIMIPYLFWSVIYFTLVYRYGGKQVFADLFKVIIQGTASYQLYFIPSLLVLYMLFPLLHKYLRFLTKKPVFLILGIIEMAILYRDYYHGEIKIYETIKFVVFNYFIFIFGMFSAHHKEKLLSIVGRAKAFFIGMTILLGFSVFLEGNIMYLKYHNYLDIYSQWRPSVLIYAIFLFLTLFYVFENMGEKLNFLKSIAANSFFIYFVHIIILELYYRFIGLKIYRFQGSDLLFLGTVFGISYLLGRIIHKSKLLTAFTG